MAAIRPPYNPPCHQYLKCRKSCYPHISPGTLNCIDAGKPDRDKVSTFRYCDAACIRYRSQSNPTCLRRYAITSWRKCRVECVRRRYFHHRSMISKFSHTVLRKPLSRSSLMFPALHERTACAQLASDELLWLLQHQSQELAPKAL